MEKVSNYLKGTRCYLIGAMEFRSGKSWRRKVKGALEGFGIQFFDPYTTPVINPSLKEDDEARLYFKRLRKEAKYKELHKIMKRIRGVDLSLCDRCDFSIAYIDPRFPSYGSIEELVTIARMKKVTFIAIRGGLKKCPLWIFGMFSPEFLFQSLSQVVSKITSIGRGKEAIDFSKWKLLANCEK